MIELVPAYTEKKLFRDMLKDYLETLHKYDSRIRFEETTVEDIVWYTEFILSDGKVSGFALTEKVDFEGKSSLLYIGEFYIVPERRNKGIGLAAVKKITENWDGDLFLYVLDGNIRAEAFWNAVGSRLGWKCTDRPEIRREPGCRLRIYSVGE